jgi:hypothetical protein
MKKITLLLVVSIFALGNFCAAQTWSATKRLTWNSGGCWDLHMASGSNNSLHIVWRDSTPGDNEIYYRKSTNNGDSWIASKRLTWTTEYSGEAWVALDSSNNPYIVWSEEIDSSSDHYDIYFRKSTNGGNNWAARKRLTWNPDWCSLPRIILDSIDNIHVVWTQYVSQTNSEIYYKKSTNGGNTWVSSKRLTSYPGYSDDVIIAVDSNNRIHLVWNDDKSGNDEIYYKKSTNGGTSWMATKRLTWTSGHSFYPYIAIDPSDNLHVVFQDDSKVNYEIYYKKSTNGGATWTTKRLTFNSGNSYHPKIAFGSNYNPQIVWADYSFGMCQILYKRSTNGGTTWAGAERLTWTSVNSFLGSLTVDDSNNPHVIFRHNVPGNYEIYYKNKK